MTAIPENEVRGLAELLAPAFELLVPPSARGGLPSAPLGGAPSVDELTAWLIGLTDLQLGQVLRALGKHDRVVAALARLQPSGAAAPNAPAPHVILASRLPVVDRVEIWSRLHALHLGPHRILSIRGVPGSGKTYSAWLVMEFCQRLGRPHHVLHPFDLEGVDGLPAIVRGVLGMLGTEVPLPFDQADTTPRAWARLLAAQVFKSLNAPGMTRWLIFDHFERTARKEEVVTFFLRLAEQIAAVASEPGSPRLVLIDHAVGVPAIARGVTLEEEVRTATSTDIAVFVRNCRPEWSSGQHQAEVSRILAKLSQGRTFMEDLGNELLPLTS